ncbi:MAG: rod shape-determining protein MreC [Spirochaetales bacterium]|nr:rod shape-determining protein MreC [Spirochaetales bacterium]
MIRISSFIKKHKKWSLLFSLLLLSILLMSFSTHTVVLKPKQFGFSVVSIFQSGVSAVGSFISDTVNSVGELRQLKREYNDLQSKMTQYQELERDYLQISKENAKLREQLGFSPSPSFERIPAEIIAKDPGNEFSTIVINKGRRHGIRRDMTVIAFQDGFQGLIGKVIETGAVTSIVRPLYDESSYVAARLQDTGYEGLIRGRGNQNTNLIMEYVKKRAKEEIQYGDLVISSGMQSMYPKGIYIGRVRAMNAKEWESSLELEVEPVMDFSRLEYVYVLLEGDSSE